MARRRRALTAAFIVLAVLAAVAVVAHRPLLRMVATALIVNDRLERADAIVVVAGGTPSREEFAATLFHQGWAPRVVVSRHFTPERIQRLIKLGVRPHDYQGETRVTLDKLGVPPTALVLLDEPVKITEAELRAVHQAAVARAWRRIILVTSPEHTRRVKLIWSRQPGPPVEGLLAPVASGDFPADNWWRNRRLGEAVLHEYLGILGLYLGLAHWST
ncbi:MAG TPA: YdcF family protein [Methylomirabilota bacterium]|nr:YdcF family protein [Methylomirabilota bacterium]